MSKKQIEMWDVTITFRVRKEGSAADTKAHVKENADNMLCNSDLTIEDDKIVIK